MAGVREVPVRLGSEYAAHPGFCLVKEQEMPLLSLDV